MWLQWGCSVDTTKNMRVSYDRQLGVNGPKDPCPIESPMFLLLDLFILGAHIE